MSSNSDQPMSRRERRLLEQRLEAERKLTQSGAESSSESVQTQQPTQSASQPNPVISQPSIFSSVQRPSVPSQSTRVLAEPTSAPSESQDFEFTDSNFVPNARRSSFQASSEVVDQAKLDAVSERMTGAIPVVPIIEPSFEQPVPPSRRSLREGVPSAPPQQYLTRRELRQQAQAQEALEQEVPVEEESYTSVVEPVSEPERLLEQAEPEQPAVSSLNEQPAATLSRAELRRLAAEAIEEANLTGLAKTDVDDAVTPVDSGQHLAVPELQPVDSSESEVIVAEIVDTDVIPREAETEAEIRADSPDDLAARFGPRVEPELHWTNEQDSPIIDTTSNPKPQQASIDDFDSIIGRTGGIAPTTLIVPSVENNIAGPLNSTGEILLTGTIPLSNEFSKTGSFMPLDHYDGEAEVEEQGSGFDSILDPMRASNSISALSSQNKVSMAPLKRKRTTTIVLGALVAVSAVVAIGLLVWAGIVFLM